MAFDCFGKKIVCTDKRRLALLLELLRRGYASQIVLSSDICKRSYLHTNGGFGYDHVATNILPALKEAGVSDEQIGMMSVENPARVLAY